MLVIWEENKDFTDIIGSKDAPEINGVADQCGLATGAEADTHPSLPNYLTETSGVSYARPPFDGDCSPGGSCVATAPSIFGQEVAAGHEWRAYAESMPGNCDPSDSGPYAPRHNPAVYYPAITAQCQRWDEPLGSTTTGTLAGDVRAGALPAFATLTPNVINDMHDGTVAQGDSWLRTWLPVITAGPDYQAGHLAILVVWDEGSGDGDVRSHIPVLVLSAYTPAGTSSAVPYDNSSILRTAEDLTGVAPLGRAAVSASLVPAFHL